MLVFQESLLKFRTERRRWEPLRSARIKTARPNTRRRSGCVGGKIVYQESRSFDRKATAKAWLKKREAELAVPGAIENITRGGVTLKEMIYRYLDEYEKIRTLGKTKRATLNAIAETWLGEIEDSNITSQLLVEYAGRRIQEDGMQPQTVGSDLAHLAPCSR